ncbi:TetR/AcrR family transcriptional regulator; helix-turn-helix transcriptional regulator [Rhizobium sp. XQZ8]|uniref:TetR/AcrR family transcriptional regulator n=1 Tax=Rhizobium populisoli TaxID=2859785 RepID=UPI001C66B53B|nr:TetR/AcrR family transcriptional regulator [Rhizobium populisoli]MBW6425778.1 TetR/AcrR family transcriptional regulator; helix-turn-helix transcriptional regulator [Rhizobium populisoli]
MTADREDARLIVSRHAAKLFLERGVAGTSGDDIAEAAGLSKRTVWRYFRSKEACVEPLFSASSLRFASVLREWPLQTSIEAYLHEAIRPLDQTPQEIADDVLAVRLVALLPAEPALRTAWLMSCHVGEEQLIDVVAQRSRRLPTDFDVRLCAAAVMAALRVVDEDVSTAAITESRKFELPDIIDQMAKAIRTASTLPICDPVGP